MPSQQEHSHSGLPAAIAELSPQNRSALAVLVLGLIWQARFPDGWVSSADFSQHAGHIGERDDDGLRRTIRRAVSQIQSRLGPSLEVLSQRRPGAREDERRLRTLPTAIEEWFLRDGGSYLSPEIWQEFCATAYTVSHSPEDTLLELEESIIGALLSQGQITDALTRAETALTRAHTARQQTPILIQLADALIRAGGAEQWARAEDILTRFQENPPPTVDLFDRVQLGRSQLMLAALTHRFILQVGVDNPQGLERLAIAEALVKAASSVNTALSLADRGLLYNVQAMLIKWRAELEDDRATREKLFLQADLTLKQALPLARASQTLNGITATLSNLGSLWFSWAEVGYPLDASCYNGEPSNVKPWLREQALARERALITSFRWHQLCMHYLDAVRYQPASALPYLFSVQCAISLIEWLAVTGRRYDAIEYASSARIALDGARAALPKESWESELFEALEREFFDVCTITRLTEESNEGAALASGQQEEIYTPTLEDLAHGRLTSLTAPWQPEDTASSQAFAPFIESMLSEAAVSLPERFRPSYIESLSKQITKRIGLAALQLLDKHYFDELAHISENEPESLIPFLEGHIPNYRDKIEEVLADFRTQFITNTRESRSKLRGTDSD